MASELSPAVRELVDEVRARAAQSATPGQIRQLAAEAAEQAQARGDLATVDQVRELYRVAIDRAEQVSSLMSQLAAMTGQGGS